MPVLRVEVVDEFIWIGNLASTVSPPCRHASIMQGMVEPAVRITTRIREGVDVGEGIAERVRVVGLREVTMPEDHGIVKGAMSIAVR